MTTTRPPVAVIGGGTIGLGWAVALTTVGHEVRLVEPDAARRAALPEALRERAAMLARHALAAVTPDAAAGRLVLADRPAAALADAVLVLERAPEDLALKRSLFAELDALVPEHVVLASSSSAPFTAAAAVERTSAVLAGAGMIAMRLEREIDGFVFNRLQGAVLREAYAPVRDGVASVDAIDTVMREGLAPRWAITGPFETADLNVQGGIEAHARQMVEAYARMGAQRGQNDRWAPELVADVTAQRRALLPLERWRNGSPGAITSWPRCSAPGGRWVSAERGAVEAAESVLLTPGRSVTRRVGPWRGVSRAGRRRGQ